MSSFCFLLKHSHLFVYLLRKCRSRDGKKMGTEAVRSGSKIDGRMHSYFNEWQIRLKLENILKSIFSFVYVSKDTDVK